MRLGLRVRFQGSRSCRAITQCAVPTAIASGRKTSFLLATICRIVLTDAYDVAELATQTSNTGVDARFVPVACVRTALIR